MTLSDCVEWRTARYAERKRTRKAEKSLTAPRRPPPTAKARSGGKVPYSRPPPTPNAAASNSGQVAESISSDDDDNQARRGNDHPVTKRAVVDSPGATNDRASRPAKKVRSTEPVPVNPELQSPTVRPRPVPRSTIPDTPPQPVARPVSRVGSSQTTQIIRTGTGYDHRAGYLARADGASSSKSHAQEWVEGSTGPEDSRHRNDSIHQRDPIIPAPYSQPQYPHQDSTVRHRGSHRRADERQRYRMGDQRPLYRLEARGHQQDEDHRRPYRQPRSTWQQHEYQYDDDGSYELQDQAEDEEGYYMHVDEQYGQY
jgi:hypothetical protein